MLSTRRGETRRVCVIGAGVIGLATAVRIQEESKSWSESSPGGVEVTVVADLFSPHTTSDGSGGFWTPFKLGDTSLSLVRQWSEVTWNHMYGLAMAADGTAGEVGAQFISGYEVSDSPTLEESIFKDIMLGYRQLTPQELKIFSGARSGVFSTSLQLNVQKYLPWLMKRFKDAGGKAEHRTVESLSEVAEDYDVVVNCGGLRGGQLTSDPKVLPIRGQLWRVRAPWVKHFYMFYCDANGSFSYILPLGDETLIGGVAQAGNWSEEVDRADSERMWTNALAVYPFLKNAPVLREWAGLRPGRTTVRLEADQFCTPGGRSVPVVHNYGHGGAGVTLHWGCAADAAELVCTALHQSSPPTHSKL